GGTGAVSLAGVLASLSPHALAIDTHLPFLAISGTALLIYSDDFTMRVLTTVAVLIQTRVEGRAIVSRGRNPVSSRQAAVYGHQESSGNMSVSPLTSFGTSHNSLPSYVPHSQPSSSGLTSSITLMALSKAPMSVTGPVTGELPRREVKWSNTVRVTRLTGAAYIYTSTPSASASASV